MGGAVSSGRNNDDLIDNLVDADYIKTALVETVFRAVDRAEYFLQEYRPTAYKDIAWKNGNLHLSAPCIYSEVMEGLCLEPGLAFLNLGSGTGYLNTMAGLILGTHGVNHGIEIHEDVIQYANRKLEDFKKYSGAIDEFDFCEPKFAQGNCLNLSSECNGLYDRIYCGAACPEQYENYMKNLVKVGGILIMPINDQLLQITRQDKTQWTVKSLLPVSFASLILPPDGVQEFVHPIEVQPLSLQMLCRTIVRNLLRKNIQIEHPQTRRQRPAKEVKRKRVLKRLVVPLFDDSSDDERHVRLGGERNRDAGRATFRRDDDDGLLSFFLGMGMRRSSSDDRETPNSNRRNRGSRSSSEPMETDSDSNQNSNKSNAKERVKAVIEHHYNQDGPIENPENQAEQLDTINEINDVIVECLEVLRRERSGGEQEPPVHVHSSPEPEVRDDLEPKSDASEASSSQPSTSAAESKAKNKREKVDSGLGDEIVEAQDSSDDERDSHANRPRSKFRKVECSNANEDSSSDSEEESKQNDNDLLRVYKSPISQHMKARIQELPLPSILQRYVNYNRDF